MTSLPTDPPRKIIEPQAQAGWLHCEADAMTISAADFAARLNGRQYREEITREEEKIARDAGLVVAFGASDDLLELLGAVDEEIGAYGGISTYISPSGVIMKSRDSILVKAEWCPDNLECSWLITPSVPFHSFDIMEDDELYCRGAVFSLRPEKQP